MPQKIKETRILSIDDKARHARALKDEEGNKILEGYAAVFGQRSKLIWEWGEIFYEEIERGAFDNALAADDLDVLLTYQHDQRRPLARLHKRKGVKTLELSVDDYGLKFRATLNNTTDANDTWERVNSGDCFECSFVFTVEEAGQRKDKTEEGVPLRYITSVSGLYDVSVVVEGAYANTDVATAERSFKEFAESCRNQPEPPAEEPTQDYFQALEEEWLELKGN